MTRKGRTPTHMREPEADIRKTTEIVRQLSDDVKARSKRL
jgi:hypothetical protein